MIAISDTRNLKNEPVRRTHLLFSPSSALENLSTSNQNDPVAKAIDNKCSSKSKSDIGEKDILLGTNYKSTRNRPSNAAFRRFVDTFRDEYNSSSVVERCRVVRKVVGLLRNAGYSFLKPDSIGVAEVQTDRYDSTSLTKVKNDCYWVTASPSEIYENVICMFRFTCSNHAPFNATRMIGMVPDQHHSRFTTPPSIPPEHHHTPHLKIGQRYQASLSYAQMQRIRRRSPTTVAHANDLLQKHKLGTSTSGPNETALRKDGLLWSKDSMTISFLRGMNSTIIPTTSYSLIPKIEAEIARMNARANLAETDRSSCDPKQLESNIVGYTQQEIGHLTIVRPIILLPGIERMPFNTPPTDQASTEGNLRSTGTLK